VPRENITEIEYENLIPRLKKIIRQDHAAATTMRANAGEVFTIAYACYARIGEIVGHAKNKNESYGITNANVINQEHTIKFGLLSEKTRRRRTVFISKKKEPELSKLIVEIMERKRLKGQDNLWFPISTRWCELKFKTYFPEMKPSENVHLLRHWAATHYLEGYRTTKTPTVEQLALLGGWKRISTVYDVYSHLRINKGSFE